MIHSHFALIVAAATRTGCCDYMAVVKWQSQRQPSIGVMAAFADICSGRVSGRFGGRRAPPVMTAGLRAGLSGHNCMIETQHQKRTRRVAQLALVGTGDVSCSFSRRNNVIVAPDTIVHSLTVIHGQNQWNPRRSAMASLANRSG